MSAFQRFSILAFVWYFYLQFATGAAPGSSLLAPRSPLSIPSLNWQPRSDWLNVQQHQPVAAGDGVTDDTAALQSALDAGANGKTIYLPPGQYRITQTLVFHGPGQGCLIVGHGRDTQLFWDGPVGGCMFRSDGIAYSRYIGLSWDGRNRAAVGFDHAAAKRFETEIQHQHEAFRNFTAYGIRVGHAQNIASAEILYQNCLFENCGIALGFSTFNDYDNTIDRCEFRNCGIGVFSHKSNFYARNSHFENSRETDFLIESEHGVSIRRCTSVGSRRFVLVRGTIAPLTIQDCHVAAWTDPEAAVVLNGSPVLIFDSSFTQPSSSLSNRLPVSSSSSLSSSSYSSRIPVLAVTPSQKVLLSGNQPAALEQFIRGSASSNLYVIPPMGPPPSVPVREIRVAISAFQRFSICLCALCAFLWPFISPCLRGISPFSCKLYLT